MSRDLASLLRLLDLDPLGADGPVEAFAGHQPETSWQRVFGGQVAAQALVAAGRTAPAERSVHSLHAYFLRPGDPSVPITYAVERLRDGRSFSTRRVLASQGDRTIFTMSASFQVLEPGLEHQEPMPPAGDPEAMPTAQERAATDPFLPPWWREFAAFDLRTPADLPSGAGWQVWVRAAERLPDDPLLHAGVLAYVSDLTLLGAALIPHRTEKGPPRVAMASLDHAMWFHRPARADGWLLYDQSSPSASGARGLAAGRLFTADGALVATVLQEGLVRPLDG